MLVDTLVWLMEGDSSKLKTDLSKASKGVDDLKKNMHQGDSAASKLFGSMNKLLGLLGSGTISAVWIKNATEETAMLGAEINRVAEITGASKESVADFASGVNALGEDVGQGLAMLEQFNMGIERNEEALNAAGIAARTTTGEYRDAVSILQDVTEATKDMNAQERASLLRKLRLDPQLMPAQLGNNDDTFKVKFLEQAELYKAAADDAIKLGDRIKYKFGEMFLPMLTASAKAFNWLKEVLLNNLYPIVSGFGLLFAGVFAKLIVPALMLGITLIKALGAAMMRNPIFLALALLSKAIGEIWERLSADADGTFLAQLKEMFPNIFKLIDIAIDWFDDLAKAFDFTDVIDMVMYALGFGFGYASAIVEAFAGKIIDLIDWLKELAAAISDIAGSAWGTIAGFFGGKGSGNKMADVDNYVAEQNRKLGQHPLNSVTENNINNNANRDIANTNSKTTNIKVEQTNNINSTANAEEVGKIVDKKMSSAYTDLAEQAASGRAQ